MPGFGFQRLSNDTDTNIYMYYANGSVADQQNIEGVWDSEFHHGSSFG